MVYRMQQRSPSEILFPFFPITPGARQKAQAYVNATIEVLGVVECYMYGLREPSDPGHTVRDVYFPFQRCSRRGVEVDAGDVSRAGEELQRLGLLPNSWIHHHCYQMLRPSGPDFPPVNDKDNNVSLLDALSHMNFKTYQRQVYASLDMLRRGELNALGERLIHLSDMRSGLGVTLDLGIESIVDSESLSDDLKGMTFSIPINYSYILSLIINPTIDPPSAFSKGRVLVEKAKDVISVREKFPFQKDLYKDPYAEVAWRRWTNFAPGGVGYNDRQIAVKILQVEDDVQVDYDAIKEEVKEKVTKGLVQTWWPHDDQRFIES